MDQLIFFGVIIFFSILESIARSRRAKRQKEQGEAPPADDRYEFEWAQKSPEELPTYDDDPSYDDQPSYDDLAIEQPRQPSRGAATRPGEEKPSTETVLPGNLFEELAALADQLEAEKQKARTIRLPKQSPPIPAPEPSRPAPAPRPTPSRTPARVRSRPLARPGHAHRATGPARPDHEVHRAHALYGTDPSERPPSEQDGMDPLREMLSEDARAVRDQLRSQSQSALRQAFILKEVLGTPLGMRE